MLEELRIKNYALIDDLEVVFAQGFNVLTGETGAGKSIVVGALNLVLGGRASNETVREGASQAKVDALFRVPVPSRRLLALLKQHDIQPEEDGLTLSRVVTAEGRSRAYLCGNLVPVSVLAEVGDELVDIHGQHEHQSLLKTDRQLDLLDGFAGTEALAERVADQVGRLHDLDRAVADLEADDRERARRIEFLRYEVNEINAANLQPGEEEELKGRRNLIANAEKVFSLAAHVQALLYEGEDSSAVNSIDGAMADLNELAGIDERFRPALDQLSSARAVVEEVAADVRGHAEGLEYDPDELDRVNERLTLITDLKRKFGGSIDAILAYRDRSAAEVQTYEARDQRLLEMQTERKRVLAEAEDLARDLSGKRKAAARRLDKQVTSALQELGMKGGKFETAIENVALTLNGIDKVEFLISANPGEKVKPLRQVASGGEISRIMLALKAVFARADKIPTLIFDEIDAGVGGHAARSVALKLHELSQSHQTLCITHIAQIAARAASHYHVAKQTSKGRTITQVARIENKDRVEEIARLLDGSVSDVSLTHARALLEQMKSTGGRESV